MKIKFKKFKATDAFVKLFGASKNKPDTNASEKDEGYEYYYRRNNTYYFRNDAGNKFTIDYDGPQTELVRGQKYNMENIQHLSGTPDSENA
jgi:hypothetical protein